MGVMAVVRRSCSNFVIRPNGLGASRHHKPITDADHAIGAIAVVGDDGLSAILHIDYGAAVFIATTHDCEFEFFWGHA